MLLGRILLVILVFLPCSAAAVKPGSPALPEQLLPWKEWVLHGYEEQLRCTPSTDNPAQLQCDWPTELVLKVHDTGGFFTQTWLIQHERWIQLPGNSDNWPEDVKINGKPALVIGREGVPQVKLEQGAYEVTGSFTWISIPEYLLVPGHSGIVTVTLNDTIIEFPNLDEQGRLWLQAKNQEQAKVENRLIVQGYRLIDDSIPLKIDTYLQLDVSGTPREITLGPALPMDRFVPVSLNSTLPARLEPDGRLRIQVRPGQWNLTLTARHLGPVSSLQFNRPDDGFWPQEEIWVFSSQPSLRVVEIEGVPAIDPLQTSLPQQWQKFPAYRLLAGDIMRFKEIKRGDPVPAPDQLNLDRNIWLRFDGSGYTVQDTITGAKKTNWRLEANPPTQLGRVAVDGQEQFITRQKDSEKTGVELRKGRLDLVADSEYFGNISHLPATGWDHDFQQVKARLFLPPGWRLINASGVDNISATWVKRWTLLDFFIVLILTLAIARLFSKPLAILAFISLILMYHEPNAPRWIWLAILVCVALLRYLPEGRFRKSIKGIQLINILILIAIAIPFSIEQLRTGIYPQLEKPWQSMSVEQRIQPATAPSAMSEQDAGMDLPAELESMGGLTGRLEAQKRPLRSKLESSVDRYSSSLSDQVAQYDPTMINQTGPGLPNWQWNTVPMSWSGPVQRDQQISLLLLGPTTNLILSFLRVLLLVILTFGIFTIRFRKGGSNPFSALRPLLLLPLILAFLYSPAPCKASDIPSPQMFEELRNRLLEKDDCFPECADISLMDLAITPDQLRIRMQVAVQTDAAIPLPGNAKHWLPQQVLVDDTKAEGLFRTNDQLWLIVKPGQHEVVLTGNIPRQNSLQLPLPISPHRVQSQAGGWTIEGIDENGKPDSQILFRRIVEEETIANQILESGVLPPFLLIERTLRLGLTWKIETTIQRVGPAGSAVVFNYPLLQGESIVTEGIRSENSQARINLDANQTLLQWESVIDKSDEINLRHADTDLWTEMWRVDVSPIFHLETVGIPVILHQQGDRWYPTWHPWPGEEVTLSITRPSGVEGQTITIDKVAVENQPGQRASNTRLTLSIRSSQGGQHTITLPGKAQLQEVKIDGQVMPIRQENSRVPLPVKPGKQEILLTWTESSGITSFYTSPEIDLGLASVNTTIDIQLPRDRWPLFMGGPLMGPAVLFWSVVLIILLVTFGLSRTGLTPLKFHQWFLLGIGMSQSNIAASILVAAWLIVLDLRRRTKPDMDKTTFNLMQIGITALTVLAISSLVMAISQGLLGHPDMNIVGNGSNSGLLKWYQDHSDKVIPQAWVFSIPMYVYRLAMLAWALWISFSLINLLKWGWKNYTEPVIWYTIPRKNKNKTPQEDHP